MDAGFPLPSRASFWIGIWCVLQGGLIPETRTQHVTDKFRLVLGVFSPLDTSWEQSIHLAWRELASPHLDVEFFYYRDDYKITLQEARSVRDMLHSNAVSAIVGPYHPLLEMVTDDERIPYIVTSLAPSETRPKHGTYSYHLMPSIPTFTEAMITVMEKFNWRFAAVLYNQPEGLTLIADMMKRSKYEVKAWRILDGSNTSEVMTHLLAARGHSMKEYAVVCDPPTLETILSVALRLSMMSRSYHWLIQNMDPDTVDYEQFAYTQVNLSIFQFYSQHFINRLNNSRAGVSIKEQLEESGVTALQYAVSVDSLNILKKASERLMVNATITGCPPYCRTEHVIEGEDLDIYMQNISVEGETGLIQFDEHKYRQRLTLSIMCLVEDGLIKQGSWWQEPPELTILPYSFKDRHEPNVLGKQKIRIVTVVEPPFVMYDEKHRHSTNNDRFKGYLIDLIVEIARRLNFEFELYESPDGNYGSKNPVTKEWNGMIRELITGEAAMCLGAISITSEREQVVDFTKPYKQKKFNLLMRKPEKKKSIFQFMWPLSMHVWLLTVSSVVVVGFLLFLMDRFSPNSDEADIGRFNLKESIWFIYGSLVGVGTEMVPRTISGRLLSGAWWFVGLILVSSYTANLAAFLTVTKIETPIKSVADLARQTKIKYGTVKNTYAHTMFRTSQVDVFKKMWTAMDKIHPDSMVDNFSVGVEKVKKEDYAFIWDQPINEYIALHDCETIAVGDPFDEKGYGIGVPLGASYRDQITMVILSLGEEGFMTSIKEKWWSGGKCEAFKETATSSTKELQLDNVAGVFVVVAMAALLAIIACFIEYLWLTTRKKKIKTRKPHASPENDGSDAALNNSLFVNDPQNVVYIRKESRL